MYSKLLPALLCFVMVSTGLWAQNPFKDIGKDAEVLSLSDGKYQEVFANDSLRKIGSVVFNTKTNQVVAFIKTDTLRRESDLRPDLVSRWLSTDPLAVKYPSLSPYNFVANNPIVFVDPAGQDIWIYNAAKGNNQKPILYKPGMKIPTNSNQFVKDAITSLNHLHAGTEKAAKVIDYLVTTGETNIYQAEFVEGNRHKHGDIEWDSEIGYTGNSFPYGPNEDRIPPAAILFHELGHSYYNNQARLMEKEFFAKIASGELISGSEEARRMYLEVNRLWELSRNEGFIISDVENPVNLELGWGTRSDQGDTWAHWLTSEEGFKAISPISQEGNAVVTDEEGNVISPVVEVPTSPVRLNND